MTAASERRIIAYQALYAFGALRSVLSSYLSIGFIFVVQLNAAIARGSGGSTASDPAGRGC